MESAAAHEEFVGEWKQKRQASRAKLSGNAPTGSTKRAKPDKGKQQPSRKLPSNLDTLEQKDVKLLMPENSFIWKNRGAGAWISKMSGFQECSRSVSKYGEAKALELVIASAWRDWCIDAGVPFDKCPMQGLPQPEVE